jgi:hypothetical protein
VIPSRFHKHHVSIMFCPTSRERCNGDLDEFEVIGASGSSTETAKQLNACFSLLMSDGDDLQNSVPLR